MLLNWTKRNEILRFFDPVEFVLIRTLNLHRDVGDQIMQFMESHLWRRQKKDGF